MKNEVIIACPNCGHKFEVEEALSKHLEIEYKNRLEAEKKKYEAKEEAFLKEQLAFEMKKKAAYEKFELEKLNHEKEVEQKVAQQVKSELSAKEQILKETLKSEIAKEKDVEINGLKAMYEGKSEEVKSLLQIKLAYEKVKNEKEELETRLKTKFEEEYAQQLKLKIEENKIIAEENQKLKLQEKDHLIDQLKAQIAIAARKAEQGSMQIQGEVQEELLKELLIQAFPHDKIDDVLKGMKGADIYQTVHNKFGNKCGVIIYESKRTKHFSNEWIQKLKNDALIIKADLCVLVTETLPENVEKITNIENVWVCTFSEVKHLAMLLRESLLAVYQAQQTQLNKGDKLEHLYDYLISNEFKSQMENVFDGFRTLKENLDKERRGMERIWKEREKQLENIMLNATSFWGSIQGIAGSEIQALKEINKKDDLFLD